MHLAGWLTPNWLPPCLHRHAPCRLATRRECGISVSHHLVAQGQKLVRERRELSSLPAIAERSGELLAQMRQAADRAKRWAPLRLRTELINRLRETEDKQRYLAALAVTTLGGEVGALRCAACRLCNGTQVVAATPLTVCTPHHAAAHSASFVCRHARASKTVRVLRVQQAGAASAQVCTGGCRRSRLGWDGSGWVSSMCHMVSISSMELCCTADARCTPVQAMCRRLVQADSMSALAPLQCQAAAYCSRECQVRAACKLPTG